MAMTPEAKVKKKVVNLLDLWGAYYFYPVTGGYGRSGVPDIVACINGDFIAIECKAGNNKPTDLQKQNLELIGLAGGWPWTINENEIEEFKTWLTTRYGKHDRWDDALKAAQNWFVFKHHAKKAPKKVAKKAAKKIAKKATAK